MKDFKNAVKYFFSPSLVQTRFLRRQGKPTKPRTFTFAVTYKCNAKCKNCGIWKIYYKKKAPEELSLEEIKFFLNDSLLSKLKGVNLTGGEPFLREDLVEIVKLFESRKIKTFGLTTNGFDTERIVETVKELVKIKKTMGLGVSLDGLKDTHERMRGTPNCFDRIMKTIEELKKIDNLSLKISFTVTAENFKELKAVKQLSEKLGIGFSFRFAQEGNYLNNTGQISAFNEKMFSELKPEIEKLAVNSKTYLDRFFINHMIDFERNKRQIVPCFSGFQSFFLDPLGNIFPCIIRAEKVGNIREQTFKAIWLGKAFQKIRKDIMQEKCFCWNGCETVPSILHYSRYQINSFLGLTH